MSIKTQITLPESVMEMIRTEAGRFGVTPSIFVRVMLCETFNKTDDRLVRVPVKNYGEIRNYVEAKKLGSAEVFAAFAMEQYMTRYPLKTASKGQDEKRCED